MALAFFDLDRTLLSKNSGSLWIRREFKAGRIGIKTTLRAFAWLTRYHLGYAQIQVALDQAVARLQGQDEAGLIEQTQSFFEEEITHLIRPGALEMIETHRSQSDQLVLLTTSSAYLSDCVRKKLHFDAVLCNHFEVDEKGLFTGKLLRPVCYGNGKLVLARKFVQEQQLSLDDSYFYTDSVSDLPVLDAVTHPRIVAPDRKLRRIALTRGWPILDWGP